MAEPSSNLEVVVPVQQEETVQYVKAIAPILMVIWLALSIVANHRNALAGACCPYHKGTFFATNR